DIAFISSAMGVSPNEAVELLGDRILLNPDGDSWETADLYLSGNVVEKMAKAEAAIARSAGNLQYQRSYDAIVAIQPERIPFELLDFNMGERWIPQKYYSRFGTEFFDSDTKVRYFPSLDSFKVSVSHNIK